MATIGSGRSSLIRSKTAAGSAVNYTLVRYEGATTTSGTVGSSTCIYELYLFTDGFVEMRLGNWANSGGFSGHYTAGGTGTSLSPSANTTYVWNATGTTTTFLAGYQYINGVATAAGSTNPSLGASSVGSWPPTNWTSLQNASVDDAFVSVTIAPTTFFGTSRTTAYIGSNAYITFGAGSALYSGLSATVPAVDKFMFNAADRSYQRVAYLTAGGSK
jgi:hypothetical protein